MAILHFRWKYWLIFIPKCIKSQHSIFNVDIHSKVFEKTLVCTNHVHRTNVSWLMIYDARKKSSTNLISSRERKSFSISIIEFIRPFSICNSHSVIHTKRFWAALKCNALVLYMSNTLLTIKIWCSMIRVQYSLSNKSN